MGYLYAPWAHGLDGGGLRMSSVVITISRKSGSGGREIGKRLSEKLGIGFYDRNLITMSAEHSGVHPSVLERSDELLDRRAIQLPGAKNIESMDNLFSIQEETIRKVAKTSCVIVGRCADYILRDRADVIKVFIYADLETRKNHLVKWHGIDPKEVESVLKKMDKERAAYYNYHTDYLWGSIDQYDLCINTSVIDLDTAVSAIEAYVALRK